MDDIIVDPKLFVTCRLCLEDLGQYQIVPSVQQQIKYCFEIEVEPFDGLPQLICMKCKEILNKFHTIKTTFCEKQNNLRNKARKKDEIFCIQAQQDTVSSSQQAPETIEPSQPTNYITDVLYNSKKKKSKRKRPLRLSSCSDLDSEELFQTSKLQKRKSSRHKGPMPWEAEYKKLVSCKLCNSVCSNRKSLEIHSQSHDLLRAKYKNIFNRQCTVNLIKIDDKPNITGSSEMVVHSSNKIIAPGNAYFYTIYSKEEDVASTDHFNSDFIINNDDNFSRQSSDGDEEIVFKPTQRKNRLISRSSNETVVIERNSSKMMSDDEESKTTARNSIDEPLNNDQCINIDDSSDDSESDQSKLEKSGKVKQPMEAKIGDYKIIQGIISMCVNSYHKKNESPEIDMLYMNVNQNKKKDNVKISNESQLKHKVLSIGRKIINKQGFNCTGLLRYMEHKSLEIVWMPKAQLYPKDTNYIRILTKLRGDLNLDDDPEWVNVSEVPQPKSFNSVPLTNSVNFAAPIKSLSNVSKDSVAAKIATNVPGKSETSQSEKVDNQAQLDAMPAMLYLDSKGSTSDSKKLLNANPVANPKQLPKKLGPGNDSRSNKTIAQQSICYTSNDEINFCMPIITSTTSLAPIPSKEQPLDANQKNCVVEEIKQTETPAPRIKVKPASELMSQKTLNSMKEQTMTATSTNMFVSQIDNVWPQQCPMNVYVPNIAVTPILVTSPPPLSVLQLQTSNVNTAYQAIPGPITSKLNTKSEYVILDSTDFPNTKTESPIKYVKDLLQLHNIFLLDPNETLSDQFLCLIKFKVVFKQDWQKDPPVILCLSLSCFKNSFCFQVKDKNQEIIDITKITANWQWEIILSFRGDVSNKVLQNARKLGQETFDITNNFFCLLKAIKCRKPC